MAGPAELVLHNHCLDADRLSLSEDAGWRGCGGLPILDAKHLPKAALAKFLQGLYVASIGLSPIYSSEADGFIDHNLVLLNSSSCCDRRRL